MSPQLIAAGALTLTVCGLVWLHWLPLGIPGEWVWDYKSREDLGLLRYAGLGMLLLLLGAHLLWKHGLKEGARARIGVVVGLLALSLLVRYCTWKATPSVGFRMTYVTLSDVATTYYSQALNIRDTCSFLREYPRLMDAMPYHARTHPPGPTLFMRWVYLAVRAWTVDPDRSVAAKVLLEFPASAVAEEWNQRPGRDYTSLEVLAAFWVGLVIAFLGSLAVVPLYLAGTSLFGPRVGLVAGLLGVIVPSALLFPVSLDQLVFLDAALALWLLAVGLKSGRGLPLLASGAILGMGVLVTFGLLALVPAFLAVILWSGWQKVRWDSLLMRAAGFLMVAAVPAALLWAVFGCDMLVVYQKAVEAQRHELTQVVQRSYGKWVFGNLGDFFLLVGLPTSVYFLAFMGGKGAGNRGLALGRRLVWTFAGLLLVLTLSGLARGETGRIWLFLMTIPTILAANSLCEGGRDWRGEALAVLGLTYIQVISFQSNAVFLQPF